MRKLTILTLALLYVVSLAAVSVFAANAARVGNNVGTNQARVVHAEPWIQPLVETGPSAPGAIGDKSNASHMALGYFLSPGILLETTAFDMQHNSRMGRQVAVGADKRVHLAWTYAPHPYDAEARAVHYSSYLNGVFAATPYDLTGALGQVPGRYLAIDVYSNRALIVDHYGGTPTINSALDAISGTNNFSGIDAPSTVVNCEGIKCGTPFTQYDWPVVAVDYDAGGHLIVHMLAQEYRATTGTFGAVAYFRGVTTNLTVPMVAGMYGTCSKFIDSMQVIGYDIAASPYSDKVVITYPKARASSQQNADLVYVLSTDMGVTWGPDRSTVEIHNVTNYASTDIGRCSPETNVLFTADDCFHILYIENLYDTTVGTPGALAKLKHWSSCTPTCRSLVLDAATDDDNCKNTTWEFNISRISLTQCISTALGDTLLYATYNRNLGTTLDPDCSLTGKYFNGELFVSASSTMGQTWGPGINLTNTKTDKCAAGTCASEASASAARYCNDSLRIEFVEDLDAGSFISSDAGSVSTENPVRFLSYPCVNMASFQTLSCTPGSIKYPFHAVRNSSATKNLVLTDGGNLDVIWSYSIVGPTPIALVPANGTLSAGCNPSATVAVTATSGNTEGLFKNTIVFSYDSGTKTLSVPVDFYIFDSWFLAEDVSIRTATTNPGGSRMMVNQASQVANDVAEQSFSYFAKLSEDFITDGSLIMGNSKTNLSWKIFTNGQGDPTPTNPFGWLYALTHNVADSTTYDSQHGYTIASGSGTNRDTTVSFDVSWYAPHHTDSCDFYIGHFDVYKGPKATGDVTGLTIAYAVDWDVPSDTSSESDNSVGYDSVRQMIYLQGQYTTARKQGFAATAAYREDGAPITGGFAWGNQQQVYGQSGFLVDSVWKYMEAISPAHPYYSTWKDSIGDMSIVMVVAKGYTVTSTSHLKFNVVLAAKRAEDNPTVGPVAIKAAVCKAKVFIQSWIDPGIVLCPACNMCGDASGDGKINISDAVFLIAYIFAGGTPPGDCQYPNGLGDASGDTKINISDAVYLIAYIFAGGNPPHCAGM